MLRVYLDQCKWVDLARAATGHRHGTRFIDALHMCRTAVRTGAVSFPLDMYRYWETSKRLDNRSRGDVVDVMSELSRQHTMALPFGVLAQELDFALRRRFGRPRQPRRRQVFGIGMRHIAQDRIDWPEPDLSALPDGGDSVTPGFRAELSAALQQLVESEILRAGPHTWKQVGFDHGASDTPSGSSSSRTKSPRSSHSTD